MPARRAEASWKACRAVELARQGRTYDQIAKAVGYANRGTAHRVVTKALAERLVDGIDELRDIEVVRLDALQASLWPKAEKGDVRAVNAVVRIIDRRCRLLGLYSTGADDKAVWQLVLDPAAAGNTGQATGADSREPENSGDAVEEGAA